ncbi:MAG: hypothetical protein ACRD2D_06030, partial [Terriglobales bacterium]
MIRLTASACLLLAVLAAFCLTLPAAAQAAAAQAASDAVANPGRPTVSTPATLTPVGYLQFENGPMQA